MNACSKQYLTLTVKAYFSISSRASFSTGLGRNCSAWRRGWESRLVGTGTRGVNTKYGCVNNCRYYSSSSVDADVLKSWTKSVVSETVGKECSSSSKDSKEETIKRPPVATFKKRTDSGEGKLKGAVKLRRRRLSDNSWTTDPMDTKIIWVDCEMSGLDPRKDHLLEIGVIITDAELNVIATKDSIVFHVADSVLNGMDDWCTKQHGGSGLTDSCRNSKITHDAADGELLEFVQKYTTAGECPMAGNSIGFDRIFIHHQLPKFYSHFHYRNIDVTTIKELTRRWYPEAFTGAPRKKFAHRVLDDIKDSIAELKYYRSTVFANPNEAARKVAASAVARNP